MQKTLVRNALKQIIENRSVTLNEITLFFSESYQQWVDGKVLDFETFCKHIASLYKHTESMKVFIDSIAEENDIVFTKHRVAVTRCGGSSSMIKVFAEFKIFENKIISCDELTFVLEGNEEDSNLGSQL